MESAMKSPANATNAYRRVAAKEQRQRERDEFQQLLAKLDGETIAKLRYEALRAANTRMPGADPHAVVREAQLHFESQVRFLVGGES
jgi:hypothetical protein